MIGKIVKNISNCYTVECDGKLVECIPRGKLRYLKNIPCVGDNVKIDLDNKIITEILPRKNELQRPYVANIDKCLIVTSVKEPDLSLNLLDKQLLVVSYSKIEPIICFTKIDLLSNQEKQEYLKIKDYYEKLGYTICENNEITRIKELLKESIVLLTGQTGAGKSSLINKLNPNLNLKTSPISLALGRGVHTTRNTQLYNIDDFYLVDTPGFSSLDLNIKENEVKQYFPEFKRYTCEFKDCNHLKNCAICEAVEKEEIKRSRYENYLRFYKECYETSRKLFK